MKHSKLPIMIIVHLLTLTMFSSNLYEANAYSCELKNIKTLSVDTTGDKQKKN